MKIMALTRVLITGVLLLVIFFRQDVVAGQRLALELYQENEDLYIQTFRDMVENFVTACRSGKRSDICEEEQTILTIKQFAAQTMYQKSYDHAVCGEQVLSLPPGPADNPTEVTSFVKERSKQMNTCIDEKNSASIVMLRMGVVAAPELVNRCYLASRLFEDELLFVPYKELADNASGVTLALVDAVSFNKCLKNLAIE